MEVGCDDVGLGREVQVMRDKVTVEIGGVSIFGDRELLHGGIRING